MSLAKDNTMVSVGKVGAAVGLKGRPRYVYMQRNPKISMKGRFCL